MKRSTGKRGLYYDLVDGFKRDLIRRVVAECHGNRTYAAEALGLQRTYLLALIRDLPVTGLPTTRRTR